MQKYNEIHTNGEATMSAITEHNETVDVEEFLPLAEFGDYRDERLTIKLTRTEEQFTALEEHWQKLAEETRATIFMSYEWARNWWKHFGSHPRRELNILTVWDGSRLVALAPFYRGSTSVGPFGIENRLQLIGSGGSPNEQLGYLDDYGISDFLDILVSEEYREPVADMICEIIDSGYLSADRLVFHQARDDSFIMQHLYPRLQETDLEYRVEQTDTCPYIDLREQESLKGFIKQLDSSSARRRMRQTLRAEGPGEDFVIREPDNLEEIDRAVDELIGLHQDRWNEIGFPGVFYDRRFTRFFRDTISYAWENDMLWFKVAEDDRGNCAIRMSLSYNGRVFDYISGFDPNRPSAKYRPGIGLLIDMVKDAIEAGDESVELLRGEEGYKYDFTDRNFNNWRLSLDLSGGSSLVKRTGRRVSDVIALGYKHIRREARLMNVQRGQSGLLGMLPGYLSFRWQSLKMKWNSN